MSAATIDKVNKLIGKLFEFYLVNENRVESKLYIDEYGNEWSALVEGNKDAVLSFLNQESAMTCTAQPLSPEEAEQAKKEIGEQVVASPQDQVLSSAPPEDDEGVDCTIQAQLVKREISGPLRVTWQIDPPIGQGVVKSHTISLGQATSGSVSVDTTVGSVSAMLADRTTGVVASVAATTSSQLSGWFQSGLVRVTVTGAGLDNYYTLTGSMTVF